MDCWFFLLGRKRLWALGNGIASHRGKKKTEGKRDKGTGVKWKRDTREGSTAGRGQGDKGIRV